MPFDTATPLQPGLYNQQLSASGGDYYSFNLASAGAIGVSLTGLSANANLQLFNHQQIQLSSSSNPATTSELINTRLAAGSYYLRVDGAVTGYTLQFDRNLDAAKPAVFWREPFSGTNAIWHLDGTTIASSSDLPSLAGASWVMADIADMNGDGEPDLLWRHTPSGSNSIWYMNGTTIASSGSLPSVGSNWLLAGVADFNGDGQQDLLWREPDDGTNGIWYMNGTTIASSGSLPSVVGSSWVIADIADMNNDGQQDLLWRNEYSGSTGIWYLNGTAIASSGSLPSLWEPWILAGVTDFNGDGQQDLMWQEPGSSANGIWYMNGTAIASTGSLPSIGGTWRAKPFQSLRLATPIDQAGSQANALNIGALVGTAIYQESVSATDPEDWYQFVLPQNSTVTATAPGQQITLFNSTNLPVSGTLTAGTYYAKVTGLGAYTLSLAATPIILPTVNLTTSDSTAAEPNNPGSFTLTRSGSTAQALTVSLAISGTAINGTDYQSLSSSVTFAAGQASTLVNVVPVNDSLQEPSESVTIAVLANSAYTLGSTTSGTVTIADDDTPIDDLAPNTLATARAVGAISTTVQTFTDRVHSGDRRDWYSFHVETNSTVRATLEGMTADADIELWRADRLLTFSDNSGPADESITRWLTAGVYYLLVSPYENAQTNYHLNLWKL